MSRDHSHRLVVEPDSGVLLDRDNMACLRFNFNYVVARDGAISCDNLPIYFHHPSLHQFFSLSPGAHAHPGHSFAESLHVAKLPNSLFIDESF